MYISHKYYYLIVKQNPYKKVTPEEKVFAELALNMQCYVFKNTLLYTALSAILPVKKVQKNEILTNNQFSVFKNPSILSSYAQVFIIEILEG